MENEQHETSTRYPELPQYIEQWTIGHCEICGYMYIDCSDCPNGERLAAAIAAKK